jgi:hypothetical protein
VGSEDVVRISSAPFFLFKKELRGLSLTFFLLFSSCIDQLNHVSAESFRNGGDGSGQKKYGKDGCQNFVVAIAGGKLLG